MSSWKSYKLGDIAEITSSITALAYQRENVRKTETPELEFKD